MTENSQVRVGVGAIIKRGNTILIGRRRGKNGLGTWSMPGGHLDNGETPEHTAVRETQEETGLIVINPRFIGFTNDIFPDEPGKHYITLWVCADWIEGEAEPTAEMGEFQWVEFDKLPEPLFWPLQNLMQSSFWQEAQK